LAQIAFQLRHGNADPASKADPLWELSSFSEAAMTAALPIEMSPDPPLSQPRRGSTAPTVDRCCWADCISAQAWQCKSRTLWELSSFSEAAMAAALPIEMSPDPPLSQPRRGSTAPTVDHCCWADCISAQAWQCSPCKQSRSPVGAAVGQIAFQLRHGNADRASKADPLWELSSFSEAAMTAALPIEISPDPPLSQSRRGSTAPTSDRCR